MSLQHKKQQSLLILTGIGLFFIAATLPGCKEQSAETENSVAQTNEEEINQPTAAMADVAPALETVTAPVAIPKEIPATASTLDFTVTDIEGKKHSLSDYRGKNVMVIFWATWCPPCRVEIPHLIELRNKFSQDELAMLAISNESAELVKKFVAENKMNYTVVATSYRNLPSPLSDISAIPTSFFIDASGQIRHKSVGLMTLEQTLAVLEKLK